MDYRNKFLENRWNTSCKIIEEFDPKSLKNFLQNRRTGFIIAEELAPKSPKNFLQNRWKTCSIMAEKLAQKSPENLLVVAKLLIDYLLQITKRITPKWLKTCYNSAEEEIEKILTRSIDARRITPAFNRCMELLAAVVRLF